MIDAMTLPVYLMTSREATGGRAPQKPMNEAQFEAFYRGTARSLWSYIYRLIGNATATDDLLQKTFFRFLRANPAVESEDHMRRYLFRAATNLVMDHFREAKRERGEEMPQAITVDYPARELRHDMQRVFSELKPQERALLWLAHVEEASHDEIGEALNVKSKSVRVLLFRARKRLAEVLKKYELGPEMVR
jgi:RNA polymerase sigma-70 factor, ECF subfamily